MRASTSEETRLRALESTRLLDSGPEAAFDRLTRLVAGLLHAPFAAVTLVDKDRQYFKSAFGLGEPWASRRETPLGYSFCQYATRERAPLVVSDAREHPLLKDSLATRELALVAYAGVPLVIDDEAIGAFCVVDVKPRAWTQDEVGLLEDLAKSVVSEIELRMALRAAQAQRALMDALVDGLGDAVLAVDPQRTFLVANKAARRIFDEGVLPGNKLPPDWSAIHASRLPDGSFLPPEQGALGRGLRGEDTDALTFTLQRPGAREAVWVEVSGRPVRGPGGEVVAAIAVYRDVTERKRLADLYATLVSHIPQAAVSLFDQDLKCVAIDGGMARVDPEGAKKLVGKPMRALAGAEGDARFDPVERMYRATLAGESSTADFAIGARVMELHTAPVRDGYGRVTGGLVLALDKTAERKTEAALRRSEEIYRAIVKHMPNGAILMVDQDLRYIAADGPAIGDMLRLGHVDAIVGRHVPDVASEENRDKMVGICRSVLRGERVRAEIQREDRVFDLHAAPIYDGPRVTHALLRFFDVTARKREAQSLEQAQELFKVTLENIEDGVALLDADRRVVLANRMFGSMFGLTHGEVEGLTKDAFIAHVSWLVEDPSTFVDHISRSSGRFTGDFVFVRPRRRVMRRSWAPIAMPSGRGFLVTWHDITAERDLLTERERQLVVDALTGIPNRRGAEQALRLEHQRRKRAGVPLSVAVFDIDHFKRVNDEFGHAMGDEVLRQVAATLSAEKRVTDTVARWGGEEFLAVLPVSLDGARVFCERARASVQRLRCPPLDRVSVSAGVAEMGDGETPEDAIARADARLYEAKRGGRDQVKG
ncbi:MAG TPA: diguanylate cyclase [Polyangiaceae bacterium]